MNDYHIFRAILPLRIYTVNQKYIKNKHGDVGVYKKKIKKWIKSNKPYRRQKRGLEKFSIYSTRFGYLDLYNRKEQQELICPSGYSISQCFNVLRKLWYGFRRAIGIDKDIDKMKKYAKAIQDVQKDMGIKTASFPHLGLYGDALILRPKNGESIVTLADDVSPYVKRDSEVTVPLLLKPDNETEEIQTLVDNPPFQRPRRRRLNIPFQRPRRRRLNIPFQRPRRRRLNRNGESILTIADDVSPYVKRDSEVTVPLLLKPDNETEEIQTLVDNIPIPYENQDSEVTVPLLLKPDNETEEIQTLVDNTPFQRSRQF